MKQRSNFWMRVLFCKIQCPSFFSLCKPSRAPHLYTTDTLKLEKAESAPDSNIVSVVAVVNEDDSGYEDVNGTNSDGDEENDDNTVRSCIKKRACGESGGGVEEKKKVQWMDNFGKELVEVKEFESSETGDTDNEWENRTCSCLNL